MAMAKSSTGFAAVLVAAVTAAHFVTTPASRVQVSEAGSAPLVQKHRHPPRHESAVYKGGCSAFLSPGGDSTLPEDENRGVATEVLNKFFGTDTSNNDTDTLPRGVHYVVALAPDPVHTNLSLMFDREMVMIQQAAQNWLAELPVTGRSTVRGGPKRPTRSVSRTAAISQKCRRRQASGSGARRIH
jgi:hypothetical protein